MNIFEQLVKHFGTQVKTGEALGTDQTTVSGWVTGKRGMHAITALKAEQVTGGAFRAVDLCPALKRVDSAA
ncbi:YdaS family helix-turn-helix protein [Pseudomonas sp.]|uniref:YdaS family helix-turn-helix protein n=1 Tax=Pseudomonas sp. TaxID=306 RepID=UPI0019FD4218|nr:YdaS family helix-turn-helix protein [Pseudomonas sp.]MBF0675562.1 helix-turn-helix domain-containing protein [Pseudomonas sp.]